MNRRSAGLVWFLFPVFFLFFRTVKNALQLAQLLVVQLALLHHVVDQQRSASRKQPPEQRLRLLACHTVLADSRKIGFYRFDNTEVPLFPIYSPFGQDGSLKETRYPKAGEKNPVVTIGIADLSDFRENPRNCPDQDILWLDFGNDPEQYFGTPFWGPDGDSFFVSRMPRSQQSLELYGVSAADGTKSMIYSESSSTWVDWISGALFTRDGLYMPRCLDSEWQQVYFLSYDGKELRQLTDGKFWNISLLHVDPTGKEIFFSSKNESTVRASVYRTDKKGRTSILTDPAYDVRSAVFSPDGKYFAASYSNSVTPVRVAVFPASGKVPSGNIVADMAGADFDPSDYASISERFRHYREISCPFRYLRRSGLASRLGQMEYSFGKESVVVGERYYPDYGRLQGCRA